MDTFPTYTLYKAGVNEEVVFTKKKKSAEALEKFLEKNCKVDLSLSNSLRDESGKHIIKSEL